MTEDPEPGPAEQAPEQTAAYIAAMARSLALMAHGQRLETLGYLLDMVRIEAESQLEGWDTDN